MFLLIFSSYKHILFSAEFGDYDSPDIAANYLDDFKVCLDQVS
jgi:hypothetical protein